MSEEKKPLSRGWLEKGGFNPKPNSPRPAGAPPAQKPANSPQGLTNQTPTQATGKSD